MNEKYDKLEDDYMKTARENSVYIEYRDTSYAQ